MRLGSARRCPVSPPAHWKGSWRWPPPEPCCRKLGEQGAQGAGSRNRSPCHVRGDEMGGVRRRLGSAAWDVPGCGPTEIGGPRGTRHQARATLPGLVLNAVSRSRPPATVTSSSTRPWSSLLLPAAPCCSLLRPPWTLTPDAECPAYAQDPGAALSRPPARLRLVPVRAARPPRSTRSCSSSESLLSTTECKERAACLA